MLLFCAYRYSSPCPRPGSPAPMRKEKEQKKFADEGTLLVSISCGLLEHVVSRTKWATCLEHSNRQAPGRQMIAHMPSGASQQGLVQGDLYFSVIRTAGQRISSMHRRWLQIDARKCFVGRNLTRTNIPLTSRKVFYRSVQIAT